MGKKDVNYLKTKLIKLLNKTITDYNRVTKLLKANTAFIINNSISKYQKLY